MSSSSDGETRGGLKIQSVEHRYGNGSDAVTALGPVDLDVEPGNGCRRTCGR